MVYLKNFCFKDAVKVEMICINNNTDFDTAIFERNIFSKQLSTFCLLQQITLDNDKKYFIFGIKFNDIYIPEIQENRTKRIFIYEKTYLFISNDPLCKLFMLIFQFILKYKKLNFFKHFQEYKSLLDTNKIKKFNELNQENVSKFLNNICMILYRME